MRQGVKDFVDLAAQCLPIRQPIYEFGSYQVAGQEGFADLRPLFPGLKYVGCDMRAGPGVDLVVNLHKAELPDQCAATVLAMDTLEHVEYPHDAVREMHRVLDPEGILIISSVMKFVIHDHPYDYWRFTPEAFRSLLKPFASCFVGWAGEPDFPHTVVGIGFRGPQPDLTEFEERYRVWQKALAPRRRIGKRIKQMLKSCRAVWA